MSLNTAAAWRIVADHAHASITGDEGRKILCDALIYLADNLNLPLEAEETRRRRSAAGEQNFGGDFRLRVKRALISRGVSVTELAARIRRARNTVSMAINHPIFPRVREQIARELKLETVK